MVMLKLLKRYKTRDGRDAVVVYKTEGHSYILFVGKEAGPRMYHYNPDGTLLSARSEHPLDIVSETKPKPKRPIQIGDTVTYYSCNADGSQSHYNEGKVIVCRVESNAACVQRSETATEWVHVKNLKRVRKRKPRQWEAYVTSANELVSTLGAVQDMTARRIKVKEILE